MRAVHTLFLVLLTICFVASCGSKNADNKTGQTTDSTSVSTTPNETPTQTQSNGNNSSPQNPATENKPAVTYVTVPESTAVMVKLVDSIDTDIDQTGKKFKAQLSVPVVVNGTTVFPAGANAQGVLDTVIESGHLKTPAEVRYHLTSVEDAGGDWVTINTYELHEKYGSHTKREVAMIGGGAVIGGAIGTATGKKGGTIIGAAAGAAAGTAAAALSGKKDIVYSAGTEIVFILSQPEKVALKQ